MTDNLLFRDFRCSGVTSLELGNKHVFKDKRFLQYFFYLLLFVALVSGYSNCGDVHLRAFELAEKSYSVKISGEVPPPVNPDSPLRIVFIIDQSHSMKFSGCSSDLDGTNPLPDGPDCNEQSGSDALKLRYRMIDHWINNLEWLAPPSNSVTVNQKVKVAVIPFSGGKKQPVPPIGGYTFKSLQLAKEDLRMFERLQDDEPMNSNGKKMGTTVPRPAGEEARKTVQKELQLLEEQKLIANAKFEVVLITDGNFKPREVLLQKAKELAGCPSNCNGNPHPACYPDGDLGWKDGITPYIYCQTVIPQKFAASFGSYEDNTPLTLGGTILSLADENHAFNAAEIKLKIIKTNYVVPSFNNAWDGIPDLMLSLASNQTIKKYEVTSALPPFSIQPREQPQLTYVIKNFHAINLNAYVNEFGELITDSDADGISDKEELASNLNPVNPRTDGRKCLDGISKFYGCEKIKVCDPLLDIDADGLNECEEITLKTDPISSDTDNDDIMDSFEVRGMGLNPNFDESTQSRSGDGMTDHQHFTAGVHIQVPLDSVALNKKVDFRVTKIGEKIKNVAEGVTIKSGNYEILVNLLPVVKTKEVKDADEQWKTQLKAKSSIKVDLDLMDNVRGTNHKEMVNQYLFLIKVAALENPETTYWLMLRRDVQYSNGNNLNLNLNLSDFHQLMYIKRNK